MIIATAAGRLGRDAELKVTQNGTDVCTFSIGCDRGFGERKATEWIQCVVFKERAKALAPLLTKGRAITVMGEAKATAWAKDGNAKGAIEIVADKIVFQSKSERTNESGGGDGGAGGDLDDEIPF